MRMKREHRASRRWRLEGCWKRRRKRMSEGWRTRDFYIPRESGAGPLRAPCLIRGIAVSVCRLPVRSFTEYNLIKDWVI
jgi:hypothetical protein